MGRAKQLGSIYKKIEANGPAFEEIHGRDRVSA